MSAQPVDAPSGIDPPGRVGPCLAERIEVLTSVVPACEGLDKVLWQGTGDDLERALAAADAATTRAAAARYAVIREAVRRGEVSASQAGSVHQWVRERAPGLAGDGLGAVVKAIDILSQPAHAAFDVAVLEGRVSAGVGLACAREWESLADRVTEQAAATVQEALVVMGEKEGSRGVRRLRPALLARHGIEGEFQQSQDDLLRFVRLSGGRSDERGLWTYEFTCDPEGRAVLEAAIGPLTRPLSDPETGERDVRTAEQRRGQALVEALRRTSQVTSSGGGLAGTKATLVLTMVLEDLRRRVGAAKVLASVAHESLLAPETLRRLACDAAIIPAVLGGDSEVLDLGLTQRLFQPAQVKALWLRDGGCTFPGCSAPAAWCDAHHVRHWVDGGPTALSNAALLCGRHHTVVHRDHLVGSVGDAGVVWDLRAGDVDGQLVHGARGAPGTRAGPRTRAAPGTR